MEFADEKNENRGKFGEDKDKRLLHNVWATL